MKRRRALALAVVGPVLFAPWFARPAGPRATAAAQASRAAGGQRSPVLVELFTSEGCSSCPPADALLARLEKAQPVAAAEIIALELHVDYWDHLGWRDPYSSARWSARQNEYAWVFGGAGVYTPQMVVDGRSEFVGSDEAQARQAILQAARAPKVPVQLGVIARPAAAGLSVQFQVRVGPLGKATDGSAPEVFLAVTEGNLRSDVARGENAGRQLGHMSVVRELKRIGSADPQAAAAFAAEPVVTLAREWKRENLRAVVFMQDHRSRRVLGAAAIALPAD